MSANKFLPLVFLLCCFVDSGLFKQLPGYINVCKRDPDTINDCAKHSIEALRSTLIKGIPELDVPGIDPFYIDKITPATGASTLTASGRDVKVTGFGNFTIKSLNVDLDSFTIKARVKFPKLHFDGKYKLDTQLLTVPISGEGTLSADAVKCDAELILKGQITERDGAEYIHFNALDIDVNIKDYRIKLDGLFNGDKVLGEAANQAINQNRGEFLRAAKPVVEKTVSTILLDLADKIVKDLTLEQLLPKP